MASLCSRPVQYCFKGNFFLREKDQLRCFYENAWFSLEEAELERFLPSLGMNDECLEQMPRELWQFCGKGLRFWQYPNQLAGLICLLRQREARSYLEIGSRWGGTCEILDSLLRAGCPELRSYAVDVIEEPPLLQQYRQGRAVTYVQGSSADVETWLRLPEQIDVVFIDGDHSWEGVKRDFNMAMKLCPQTVIFHDTASDACPDVRRYWSHLREIFADTHEFHEQYESVRGSFLGIGVVLL